VLEELGPGWSHLKPNELCLVKSGDTGGVEWRGELGTFCAIKNITQKSPPEGTEKVVEKAQKAMHPSLTIWGGHPECAIHPSIHPRETRM
jgi:hypothetical protein